MTTVREFSLKQVEVAFESLIDAERKRAEGAVYTPNYVIDHIVRQCIEIRSKADAPSVLDPACGSGGFLVRSIPIVAERYNIPKEKVINELIYGIDINADAIECAKLAIELFCAETSTNPPSDFNFLLRDDALLAPKRHLLDAFGIDDEGFDVILTNPPYVKLQNLDDDYRPLLYDAYPEFTMGSFSLALLFLVAGYRLLSSSGILGYITQNNIYTSLAGEGVRDFLQRSRGVHTIVDFGHKKIFPGASAYTCLIFLDRTPQDFLRFRRCLDPEAELPRLRPYDFHHIETAELKKDKWRLAPAHHLRNLQRLEANGTPLGELADIRVGFATLKDYIFLIDGESNYSNIELGVTSPAIKIADFADEMKLRQNQLRVIQPYRRIGQKWVILEEDELQQLYPNAYTYLKSHQVELAKRDKGRRNPHRFYEWGRSQCMEAPGPKLLTKTFSRGPNFLFDETDSLFCNGYSVKPKESISYLFVPVDIRVLQILLNSWVMDYYARLTSFQIEGGYQCFQKNFIERFCLPDVKPNVADTILRLTGITLQHYICELFELSANEVLQVIPQ